jgi:hypothetical protein
VTFSRRTWAPPVGPLSPLGTRVASPTAKYSSCSRAHRLQKRTPRMDVAAGRRHGRCLPLPTWHRPGPAVALVKTSSLLSRPPAALAGSDAPPGSGPTRRPSCIGQDQQRCGHPDRADT